MYWTLCKHVFVCVAVCISSILPLAYLCVCVCLRFCAFLEYLKLLRVLNTTDCWFYLSFLLYFLCEYMVLSPRSLFLYSFFSPVLSPFASVWDARITQSGIYSSHFSLSCLSLFCVYVCLCLFSLCSHACLYTCVFVHLFFVFVLVRMILVAFSFGFV